MSRDPLYQRLTPPLKAFFAEHLPCHRGLSPNTIKAYRDSWTLLLCYGTEERKLGPPEEWTIGHLDRQLVLDFLAYLERVRKVGVRTRNARLAAIHSFYHYLHGLRPELDRLCRQILSIPTKRCHKPVLGHLEVDELRAVLAGVKLHSSKGRRDLALLVFAYNTGARVHEMANARHSHILRGKAPSIRILGKGQKIREVPLWDSTIRLLDLYTAHFRPKPCGPTAKDYLFVSMRGQALTRYTVSRLISHHIAEAGKSLPSLNRKNLTAHSLRHTTAVHLLQSGVEMNVIRTWLGHASNASLQVYLGLDISRKRDILEHIITPELERICTDEIRVEDNNPNDFLDFLDSL